MKVSEPPIIVEQIFDQSIEIIWNAITINSQMKHWYFDNIPEFKTQVGFKTQFNVQAPSRDFLHLWEITEVIPFQKLTYNWTFKDCSGSSDVSFELFEQDSKTLLRVTNKVIEDFDDSIQEFKRDSCQGGWNYFIKDSLKNYLSN